MRALITGATGFVGSNVVRVLVDQGHHVSALVRPTSDRGALAKTTVGWRICTRCGSGSWLRPRCWRRRVFRL